MGSSRRFAYGTSAAHGEGAFGRREGGDFRGRAALISGVGADTAAVDATSHPLGTTVRDDAGRRARVT